MHRLMTNEVFLQLVFQAFEVIVIEEQTGLFKKRKKEEEEQIGLDPPIQVGLETKAVELPSQLWALFYVIKKFLNTPT